jgi:hypothetical protein
MQPAPAKRAASPPPAARKRSAFSPDNVSRGTWVAPRNRVAAWTRPTLRTALEDSVPVRAIDLLATQPAAFGHRHATEILEGYYMPPRMLVRRTGRAPVSLLAYCRSVLATPAPDMPDDVWALIVRHLTDRRDRRAFGLTCRRVCAIWRSEIRELHCFDVPDIRCGTERIVRAPYLRVFHVHGDPRDATSVVSDLYRMADPAHLRAACTVSFGGAGASRLWYPQKLLGSVAVVNVRDGSSLYALVSAANAIPPAQHCAVLSFGAARNRAICDPDPDIEPPDGDPVSEYAGLVGDERAWLNAVPRRYWIRMSDDVAAFMGEISCGTAGSPDHAYPRRTLYMPRAVYALHAVDAARIDAADAAAKHLPIMRWWRVLDVRPDPEEPHPPSAEPRVAP